MRWGGRLLELPAAGRLACCVATTHCQRIVLDVLTSNSANMTLTGERVGTSYCYYWGLRHGFGPWTCLTPHHRPNWRVAFSPSRASLLSGPIARHNPWSDLGRLRHMRPSFPHHAGPVEPGGHPRAAESMHGWPGCKAGTQLS